MCVCMCACLHVHKLARARACLWLYACVGACMCVYICVQAEVCTCMLVHTCVNTHACTFTRVFVCASVHTGLRACMCARAGVRACTCARMLGWVHAHMREVCVSFLFLHHLRPGNLQWGWLACPAHTQTLVLLVLLLLNPLLSNHWLLLNHNGFPFTRGTAVQYHKNNC
jgi:hypothetical protein